MSVMDTCLPNGGQKAIGKPVRVVELTGSGTYYPIRSRSWHRVTMCGAGAGGARPDNVANNTGGGAGGAGEFVQFWIRVDGATTYVQGSRGLGATANSTDGSDGGFSRFGSLFAAGGKKGTAGGTGGNGGGASNFSGEHTAGGKGGDGINSANGNGRPPGYSGTETGTATFGTGTHAGGGGGDSVLGQGGRGGNDGGAGTGTTGQNGTGYGSGGGGGGSGATATGNGGDGTDGRILVEEWGDLS